MTVKTEKFKAGDIVRPVINHRSFNYNNTYLILSEDEVINYMINKYFSWVHDPKYINDDEIKKINKQLLRDLFYFYKYITDSSCYDKIYFVKNNNILDIIIDERLFELNTPEFIINGLYHSELKYNIHDNIISKYPIHNGQTIIHNIHNIFNEDDHKQIDCNIDTGLVYLFEGIRHKTEYYVLHFQYYGCERYTSISNILSSNKEYNSIINIQYNSSDSFAIFNGIININKNCDIKNNKNIKKYLSNEFRLHEQIIIDFLDDLKLLPNIEQDTLGEIRQYIILNDFKIM